MATQFKTVPATGLFQVTSDSPTETVTSATVQVSGLVGSMTPQFRTRMNRDTRTPPTLLNKPYWNEGTHLDVAPGTAITADGFYEFNTDGSCLFFNVTALTGMCSLEITELVGPAPSGGGSSGGGLTDTQLRATPVPVSGTVEVTNDVGNPLPVSGTVEVVNDVGNPLPVSGTVEIVNDVGNAIPVSLATAPVLVAGEAHIGSVGGATSNIKPTIAVTASAYATGNCWGGKQTLTNALRSGGPLTGAWAKLTCTWKGTAASAPLLDAVLLTDNPAGTFTDKSAFPTLSTADIALISSRVSITASDWVALGGVAVATKVVGPLPVTGIAATLYAAFNVTSGTPTPVATTDFGAVFGFFND